MRIRLATAAGPLSGAAGVIVLLAAAWSLADPDRAAGPRREPGGDGESLVRAVRSPADHAWALFDFLNHQAAADRPGQPDARFADLHTYEDDRDVVWETWTLASALKAQPGPVERLRPAREGCEANILPAGLPFVPGEAGRSIEVRLNAVALSDLAQHRLMDRAELKLLFTRAAGGGAGAADVIDLQPAAKVVKARWMPRGARPRERYHWRTIDGQEYVLVALHIMSKDLPTWFWATFVHADEPSGPAGRPAPAAAAGSKWSHYRLLGTQQGFVDERGCATRLWNRTLGESPRSSCVTCHASAAIHASGRANGETNRAGAPDPGIFWGNCATEPCDCGPLQALQTDFLWFIALHAEE